MGARTPAASGLSVLGQVKQPCPKRSASSCNDAPEEVALSLLDCLQFKPDIAHLVVTEELPFIKYPQICELESYL